MRYEGQTSDSDDVAILETPPNKYHLRSSKESSDDEIPEILQKSLDSPWKSPPKVKPKHAKELTPTKPSKSNTPSTQQIGKINNESSIPSKQSTSKNTKESSTPTKQRVKPKCSTPK